MIDKIKEWITINHQHVPIKEGESKKDVVSKFKRKKESNRRQNLVDFAQNKKTIKKLSEDFDDKKVAKKVLKGKSLTAKEYAGYISRKPREGDIIIGGGRKGEDVRVGTNGKLETISNYKRKKRSNSH